MNRPSRLAPGSSLGDYEILEFLGAGGMGEVYRARDPRLGREIALKVLPAEVTDDFGALERFEREAKALGALNHPNIVTIHSVEESDGIRFLTMELVQGESLAELIAERGMALDQFFDLAIPLTEALASAHSRGLIHRDLKPSNIMLSEEGRLKVLDFGLAKLSGQVEPADSVEHSDLATATLQELTQQGQIMGTVPYMSPEQIRADVLDARSDLFSLGVILFEMACGSRPFLGNTPVDLISSILKEEPPDPCKVRWELPEPLARVISRCLAKDRQARVASASELRDHLLKIRDDSPRASRAEEQASPASRTVAVLPFETLGRKEATPFTDGVHGDILTRLSKVPDLSVTSRMSVMQYRNPDRSLPEIANELGVTWVLLGEVQEAGNQVQVNARLAQAVQDRQVWAESYRRQLTAENLFEIQSELTEEIAAKLQAQLTPEQQQAGRQLPTRNLDAYRLYVEGLRHLDQWTEEEMRRAAESFQRSLDCDPDYALAWAGLADAVSLLRWYGFAEPEGAPTPEAASRRAVELAPDLAEAHLSRAIVLSSSRLRDGPRALREFEQATRLQPSLAVAYVWMGWLELLMGSPEQAVEPAEQAVELDPLAPQARIFLAEIYLARGETEAALREAIRGRELQPEKPFCHYIEALALYHLGRLNEAQAVLEKTLTLAPPIERMPTHSQINALLAVVNAALGDSNGARRLSSAIDTEADPFSAGLVHAALGEQREALQAFERVCDWGQLSIEHLRYFFPEVLGPLRDSAQFKEFLQRADQSWGVRQERG